MPNWVENYVSIVGPEETISTIKEQLAQPSKRPYTDFRNNNVVLWDEWISPFQLWNIVSPKNLGTYALPCPNNHKDNWYDWNVRNWGCKWEAKEVVATQSEPNRIVYIFETPWSAPIEGLLTLAKNYPAITITLRWNEEQGFGQELDITYNGIDKKSDWGF